MIVFGESFVAALYLLICLFAYLLICLFEGEEEEEEYARTVQLVSEIAL